MIVPTSALVLESRLQPAALDMLSITHSHSLKAGLQHPIECLF